MRKSTRAYFLRSCLAFVLMGIGLSTWVNLKKENIPGSHVREVEVKLVPAQKGSGGFVHPLGQLSALQGKPAKAFGKNSLQETVLAKTFDGSIVRLEDSSKRKISRKKSSLITRGLASVKEEVFLSNGREYIPRPDLIASDKDVGQELAKEGEVNPSLPGFVFEKNTGYLGYPVHQSGFVGDSAESETRGKAPSVGAALVTQQPGKYLVAQSRSNNNLVIITGMLVVQFHENFNFNSTPEFAANYNLKLHSQSPQIKLAFLESWPGTDLSTLLIDLQKAPQVSHVELEVIENQNFAQ